MGGDYTSWGGAIKPNRRYSTTPQLELEHCRDWLRLISAFAGAFAGLSKLAKGGTGSRSTTHRNTADQRFTDHPGGDARPGRGVAEALGPDRHERGAGAHEIGRVGRALHSSHPDHG